MYRYACIYYRLVNPQSIVDSFTVMTKCSSRASFLFGWSFFRVCCLLVNPSYFSPFERPLNCVEFGVMQRAFGVAFVVEANILRTQKEVLRV